MKNSINEILDNVTDEICLNNRRKSETGDAQSHIFFKQHPQFSESYNTLHARPFFISTTPLSISHVAFLHQNKVDHQQELSHLSALCSKYNVEPHRQSYSHIDAYSTCCSLALNKATKKTFKALMVNES